MFKKAIIPIFFSLAALVVLAFGSVKFISAAAYVATSSGLGYQINVNQGVANFTAQTRSISIDTAKVTTSFFVPAKTINEVDAYISSALHNAVKVTADVTPPSFTYLGRTDGQPGATLSFFLSENGYYKTAYSTTTYPTEPGTSWVYLPGITQAYFPVGDNYSTLYYWKAFYKDMSNNLASTTGQLTTTADATPPVISVGTPALSVSFPPAYEQSFTIDENGQYGSAWSTTSYPTPTINIPINANTPATIMIGDTVNTGYYYTISAKDALNNTSSYTNYLVTSAGDTTGPVLSRISDKTPGVIPPASDIMFDSDEEGGYQIVYASDQASLPAPGRDWLPMSAGTNYGAAGDGTVNTNFYYIIYAQDLALNTSDSGILTVGNPGTGDITITGYELSPTTPPGTDVMFTSNLSNGVYQMHYNTDGDFSALDGNLDGNLWIQMINNGTIYRVTVGDMPAPHYYYKIYTFNKDTGINSDTGILELTTGGSK